VPVTRDFDLLWDYDNPAETEAAFRAVLPGPDDAYRLELRTQLARALGLQRRFEEAHAELDQVEKELGPDDRTRIRYLLERGRAFNSSGDKPKAQPLFLEAFKLAQGLKEDFLAVDTAHMIAIIEPPHAALAWNEKAVALAEKSEDERARNWLGSLYNNIGWTYHGQGRFEEALIAFKKALDAREAQGKREPILIARWCVARCFRSLGRLNEAFAAQHLLLLDREEDGKPDGYVHEEIAECFLEMGRKQDAAEHFAKAHEVLSKDPWFQANEAPRLKRMLELASA
jgi:tetratricopeptide (TPR) repeat protein